MRLAEVQARWERRLVSATAALGAAVRRLEEAAVPVAEDVRDTCSTAVVTLVEDLLGRELALADSPGLDALRRAMTLCPDDAPAVVRLHPDDLAEMPAEALAGLPGRGHRGRRPAGRARRRASPRPAPAASTPRSARARAGPGGARAVSVAPSAAARPGPRRRPARR